MLSLSTVSSWGTNPIISPINQSQSSLQSWFNSAKPRLMNSKLISEQSKLLINELNFDDFLALDNKQHEINEHLCQYVDEYIEKQIKKSIDISNNFLKTIENSFKYNLYAGKAYSNEHWNNLHQTALHNLGRFIIEQNSKLSAKHFYNKILGDSTLGKDLKEKAFKTIDSSRCIKGLTSKDIKQSYAFHENKPILCTYFTQNDLVHLLVHETAHILDLYYRKTHKLNALSKQQSEYVSFFFESLLDASGLEEPSLPQSRLNLRLFELYFDALDKDLVVSLITSLNKQELDELSQLIDVKIVSASLYRNLSSLDKLIHKLETNPSIKQFLDWIRTSLYTETPNVRKYLYTMNGSFINKEKFPAIIDNSDFKKYLNKLDQIKNFEALKTFLNTVKSGKFTPFYSKYAVDYKSSELKLFSENLSIYPIPTKEQLNINWGAVIDLINFQSIRFYSAILANLSEPLVKANIIVNYQKNKSSPFTRINYAIRSILFNKFYRNVTPPSKLHDVIHKNDYLFEFVKYLSVPTLLRNTSELDSHVLAEYYVSTSNILTQSLDCLSKNKPIPIEKVMQELVEAPKQLKFSKESCQQFLDYLKSH